MWKDLTQDKFQSVVLNAMKDFLKPGIDIIEVSIHCVYVSVCVGMCMCVCVSVCGCYTAHNARLLKWYN